MNTKAVLFAFLLIISFVIAGKINAQTTQTQKTVKHSQQAKKNLKKASNKHATKSTRKHGRKNSHHVKYVNKAAWAAYVANMPTTGTPPNADLANFDQKFKQFMATWKMPGAAVAIVKDGKLIFSRGYGWTDVASKKPTMPNSLFRIASASKAFTATTILKLVQEKKLSLDDKVFYILNDIRPARGGPVNPALYHITIRDLLQMASGWPAHFDPMFGPWPEYFRDMVSHTPADCYTIARAMMNVPLRYKPGTRASYSNFNYCLLGLVINKVTKQPYNPWNYQLIVHQKVLAPLRISDMRIGSTNQANKAPGEVSYYNFPGFVPDKNSPPPDLPYANTDLLVKNSAAGGWIASAEDLAFFMDALANGKILPRSLLATMISRPQCIGPGAARYFSMGLRVYHMNNHDYLVMTGSFTGTNSYVMHKPDGTVVVTLFNSRPPAQQLFSRFRPQLNNLLLSEMQ